MSSLAYGPEVGAPLTTDPDVDMVSFTGSTRVGRAAVAAGSATLKKVSMELGGKNPQLIFPDADMDAALDAAAFGAYFNAGECCNAGCRIILHGRLRTSSWPGCPNEQRLSRVGDPLDPETRVGAIISADHLGKIERHIAAAEQSGAKVLGRGQARVERLFHVAHHSRERHQFMEIATAEVFGPVVVALTFDDSRTRWSSPTRRTTASRPAFGAETSIPQSPSGAAFAPGPSGSTHSWMGRPSFRSGAIASPALAASSGETQSKTTRRKRRSTSIPVLGPVGGSLAGPEREQSGVVR